MLCENMLNEASAQKYYDIAAKVLDTWMEEFNSRDTARWAKVNNYPHYRMTANTVQQWDTPKAYAADNDPSVMREKTGWAYTHWQWIRVLQAEEDKIHIMVKVARYNDKHQCIKRAVSLYVITCLDGKWGIQYRSSFLGTIGSNTAF